MLHPSHLSPGDGTIVQWTISELKSYPHPENKIKLKTSIFRVVVPKFGKAFGILMGNKIFIKLYK
jgi:hypothetical protein